MKTRKLRTMWKKYLSDLWNFFFGSRKAQPSDRPTEEKDAGEILAEIVTERLKYLRDKRLFTVRKKRGIDEWQIASADFTDAYLFLLAIPGANIHALRHRLSADYVTYRMDFLGKTTIELTDNTKQNGVAAILRLQRKGREMLKIKFMNNV